MPLKYKKNIEIW